MPRSKKPTTAEAIADGTVPAVAQRVNACVNELEVLTRKVMATIASEPPPPPPPVYTDRAQAIVKAIREAGLDSYEPKVYKLFQGICAAEEPPTALPPLKPSKATTDKSGWMRYGACVVLLTRAETNHNYPLNKPMVFMNPGPVCLTMAASTGNLPPYAGVLGTEWRYATPEEVDAYFTQLDFFVTDLDMASVVTTLVRETARKAGERP